MPAPMRLRTPGSSGSAHPTNNMYVLVLSVDDDTKVAHVRDQVGGQRQISITRMLGKGVGRPRAGETWLVTTLFGDWTFAVQINPDLVTFVEDDDPRLSDARIPIISPPTLHYIGTAGEPAFQNSWVNYDTAGTYLTARFYKDIAGIVHINGRIKDGTGTVFTLPAGYRPLETYVFATPCGGPGVARVDVTAVGAVTVGSLVLGAATGSNTSISLAPLSFLAEA